MDLLELVTFSEELEFNTSTCEKILEEIVYRNWSLAVDIEDEVSFGAVMARCLNTTDELTQFFSQPFILPWYQQLAWVIVYASMISLAIVGNVLVMWIIVTNKRMRTITNFFLLNLAVADFLLASGNAAFNFIFMLNSHWPFGNTFCVISHFVANLTVSISVFTILAMSLDRFVAVVRPLRPSMTKSVACSIILSIWVLSSLVSLPPVLYATTTTYKYADKNRTLCYLYWPDESDGFSHLEHIYNILFLVVTYVLPMSCMSVTYTWIGCVLWSSKAIGENTDMQSQAVKSKRKVVHMLAAVMLLFAVCWLPYHVYFLYTYYDRQVLRTHFIQHVYLAIYWLAMSNSCYNPVVYYLMNARFRNYFREMCFCTCKLHSKRESQERQQMLHLTLKSSTQVSHKTRSTRRGFPRFMKEQQQHNL